MLYYNYFYLPKVSRQIAALILLHLRPFNLKKTVVQKMFKKTSTIAAKGILGSFNEIFLFSASLAFPQNRSILLVSPRYVREHPRSSIPPGLSVFFSPLRSREVAIQLAGVPETRQVSVVFHSFLILVKKEFFSEEGNTM